MKYRIKCFYSETAELQVYMPQVKLWLWWINLADENGWNKSIISEEAAHYCINRHQETRRLIETKTRIIAIK